MFISSNRCAIMKAKQDVINLFLIVVLILRFIEPVEAGDGQWTPTSGQSLKDGWVQREGRRHHHGDGGQRNMATHGIKSPDRTRNLTTTMITIVLKSTLCMTS